MKKIFIVLLFTHTLVSCGNNSGYSSSQDVELFKPTEEKWEDCYKCNGRGYLTHTCSQCDGAGRLTRYETKTSKKICSSCLGTGIEPCTNCDNRGYFDCPVCNSIIGKVRCSNCDGAGKLVLRYNSEATFVDCPMCGGEGYRACDRCFGQGRIQCRKCFGNGHITCRTCNGSGGSNYLKSGLVDGGECPSCDGTGEIQTKCRECEGKGEILVE